MIEIFVVAVTVLAYYVGTIVGRSQADEEIKYLRDVQQNHLQRFSNSTRKENDK